MAEVKHKLHVPVEEYGFIEKELVNVSNEEAVNEYTELKQLYDKEGLNNHNWAKFRNSILAGDGTFTPEMQELLQQCNKAQLWWVNQTKLALRSLTKE